MDKKITTTQRVRATLLDGEKVFSNEDPQMSGIIARLRKSGMKITSKRNYKGDDQREYVMEYELIAEDLLEKTKRQLRESRKGRKKHNAPEFNGMSIVETYGIGKRRKK